MRQVRLNRRFFGAIIALGIIRDDSVLRVNDA
jgi:hypothetical protein